MTTIVAIQYDDHCEFLSDSVVNADGRVYVHKDFKKVSENGPYLIGVAGQLVALQFIEHTWTPPALTAKDKKDLFKFVITKVVPSLRVALATENLFTEKSKTADDETLYSILLAINGTVFEIDQELSVAVRGDGLYAIGSGGSYALGALSVGATIDQAMEAAAKNDSNTGAPFVRHTQYKS